MPEGILPSNVEMLEQNGIRWFSIEQPTKEAMQYLKGQFPFHVLDYEDIVSPTHRSKVDKYPEYIFLTLFFPLLDRKTNTIHAGEIDFFLGKDYLVTVHRGDIPTFVDMFQLCDASEAARSSYMVQSTQYLLYKILQRLFQYCYPIIDHIDAEIDRIEGHVFQTGRQSLLQEILVARHSIADVRRIIQPHRQTLLRLNKPTLTSDDPDFELEKKYEDYFDDLLDYTQEIWNQLESFKESIEALHETNQALISYRMNDVVKTLTVFSAILLPAGFITGIFSMNSKNIPFNGSPKDFFIYCGITLLSMLPILIYIRRKKIL